jgi:UDP-N-acetylmuramate--alanine ligase
MQRFGEDSRLSYGEIRKIATDKSKRVHFIGVGGVSMYSLARLTMLDGASISGSDREDGERIIDLRLLGGEIAIGHKRSNVIGSDLVVYNNAISPDNPEILEAKALGIKIVSRAEYLGAFMLDYGNRIGVSGSHGKSTTVAILDAIFGYAGVTPTVLSGADLPCGEPFRVGGRSLMIYEACEYKDSFLRFSPTIALGLNLELDHTDYFEGIDALKTSFVKALSRASRFAIISGDDENLLSIKDQIKAPVITFGGGENNDYRYSITSFKEIGFDFSVRRGGALIGDFELNIPGAFNIHNATAAIAASLEYGIDVDTVVEAISLYRGIPRRLEYIGQHLGRPVYYDYAHHPTEIKASIDALKSLTKGKLTVVFKPHTFSRTKSLWNELCASLSEADYILLTDIFPAREEPIECITSEALAEAVGSTARYCSDGEVISNIDLYTSGAIVLMGAGDLEEIKRNLLKN